MLRNSGQTITSLNQQSEQCTQNNEGKLYLLACAVGCGEEGGGGGEIRAWWLEEGGGGNQSMVVGGGGRGGHLPLLLGLLKSSLTLY